MDELEKSLKVNRTPAEKAFSLAAMTVLTASMMISGPAQAAPAEAVPQEWNPKLLSTEYLFDDTVVRLRYEDGVTVVTSVGSEVIFSGSQTPVHEQAPADEADQQTLVERSVQVVTSADHAPTEADVQRYRTAGRSVYAEAIAAGFSPAEAADIAGAGRSDRAAQQEPPIYASGCVYSDSVDTDSEFDWNGCYRGYIVTDNDPGAWYTAARGDARGWGTGILSGGKELVAGYTEIDWNTGEIIEASPPGSLTGNNCDAFTIGLSQYVNLSYSVPLCDDRWAVTWDRDRHRVTWEGGSAGGSSDTRYASGANTLRIPTGIPQAGFTYRIGWSYICLFC